MTVWNKTGFVLICLMLVFTTLAYGTVHQPVVAFFYLLVGLVAILWAADAFHGRAIRFSTAELQLPFYAAAAYGLFQTVPFGSLAAIGGVEGIPRTISIDPFWTRISALHFLSLGILFSLSLVLVDSANRLRRLASVIIIFGFGYAFFAILQSVLSPDRIYGIYDALTPFGSFVNRHNFAALMEMMIAVPLGMMFAGAVRPDKRLLYITAIALMGASLLLSGSRGGLVAFLVIIFFLVMITTRGSGARKLVLRSAMALMLLVAIIGGAVFVGGDTSLTRIVDTAASKDLTTGRFDIWSVTVKVIFADLPFGSGLGAYGVAYTRYDAANGLERVEQAHNDYLQVASDAGLPGLLIGGFFLFALYRAGKRALRANNLVRRGTAVGALAGIFGILIHSIFDFVLHTTAVAVMFVVLLTILVAAGHEYPDDIVEYPDDGRRHKPRQKAKIAPFRR